MKLLRQIPTSRAGLNTLAGAAHTGALAIGAEVGLEQNTAERIAADMADFAGPPGAGLGGGKLGLFDAARAAASLSLAARRTAIKDGRLFCSTAVDMLKGFLGRKWNPQWVEAGFNTGSIKIPTNPVPVLIGLRTYFRAHAARESVPLNITAARADSLVAAIEAAGQGVTEKRQAQGLASRASKAAQDKLAKRLRSLRSELDLLLPPDDQRWYRFGFNRPVDRHLPEQVTGLKLRNPAPGMVVAEWLRAVRAKDYRVKYWLLSNPTVITELPLTTGLGVTIGGLLAGSTVVLTVAARNDAGDAQIASAQLAVV